MRLFRSREKRLNTGAPASSRKRVSGQRWRRWLKTVWPSQLLGTTLLVSGAVNVLVGVRHSLGGLGGLSTLASSLGAVGATGQAILGGALALIGIGLFWRLRAVWAFALLVLAITAGANVARHHWGIDLVLPLAVLGCLWATRDHFGRRTAAASILVSLISIVGTLAYGVIGSYVLGRGFHPQIADLISALYFTLVTLSTLGYGDIVPVTSETRIFVVTLLVIGLSVFATAIASTLGPLISGELSFILGSRKAKMEANNHIILVGEGTFAHVTARELVQRGVSFVQLLAPGAEPLTPDRPVVRREPDEESGLRKAGIERARMVIAAHDDDGRNAFTTLLAKNIDPRIKVIAVASSSRSMRPLELARADIVFAPALAGGRLLADLAEDSDIPEQFRDLLQRS